MSDAARVEEIIEYWARPWITVWAGTPDDLLVNVGRAYKDIGDLLARLRAAEAEAAAYKHVVKIRNDALDKVEAERNSEIQSANELALALDAAQAEARRLKEELEELKRAR